MTIFYEKMPHFTLIEPLFCFYKLINYNYISISIYLQFISLYVY